MSVTEFSYHHPVAYRRMLGLSCLALAACGVGSLLPAPSISALQFPSLETSLPEHQAAQPIAKPTSLTSTAIRLNVARLPGKDGSAATTATTTTAAVIISPIAGNVDLGGDLRALGRDMNALRFGETHWPALNALWTRESNWNSAARNRSSGACGIPQALPCSKITDMSPQGQIAWGLSYIQARYGNPSNAWQHFQRYHWY